jgi:hypothetical protein
MDIRPVAQVRVARSTVAPTPTEASQQHGEPADRVAAPTDARLQWPDWRGDVDPSLLPADAADEVFKLSDAFVDSHFQLEHAEQRPLFRGLARWRAWETVASKLPHWKTAPPVAHVCDLWSDEWFDVKPMTDPSADTKKAATKALGLLTMLDGYLGQGRMGREIDRFLDAYQGQPTDFKDFYQRLQKSAPSDRPLPSWTELQGWMTQAGHPILKSQVVQDARGARLAVSQEPFTLYPSDDYHNQGARFTVPIVIKFRDAEGIKTQRVLLHPEDNSIPLDSKGPVSWAYPNGGGNGWFRTQLPDREREALTRDLPQLSLGEQTAFAINQWRLVRHGTEPIGKFYDALLAMKNTVDPNLANLLSYELGADRNWPRPEDRQAMGRFMADVFRPSAETLGFTLQPKSDDTLLTWDKFIMLEWLTAAGDATAAQVAQTYADDWKSGKPVPYGLHTATRDPEVLRRLIEQTQADFRDGKASQAARDLTGWPDGVGPRTVSQLLLDPSSKVDEAQRKQLWSLMTNNVPSIDAVWEVFRRDPHLLPAPQEALQALMLSPYRRDLDAMVQQGRLDPALSDQAKALSSQGAYATLGNVSDQIHDFLAQRGYLAAPPSDWLVADGRTAR